MVRLRKSSGEPHKGIVAAQIEPGGQQPTKLELQSVRSMGGNIAAALAATAASVIASPNRFR
jgi:hypothetical protein